MAPNPFDPQVAVTAEAPTSASSDLAPERTIPLQEQPGIKETKKAFDETLLDTALSPVEIRPYDVTQYDVYGQEVPAFDSFSAAVQYNGQISAAWRWWKDRGVNTRPDPEWNLSKFSESNQDFAAALQKYLNNPSSAVSQRVFEEVASIQNAEMAVDYLERLKQSEQAQAIMAANPYTSMAGALTSIGTDIVALSFLSGGVGALVNAGKSARTIRAMLELEKITATRANTAARIGIAGATEGFLERTLQGATDPLVTEDDIIFNTVLGAVIGGGVGALTGRSALRVVRELNEAPITKDPEVVLREAQEAKAGSMGAAAVQRTEREIAVPGFASTGLNISRYFTKAMNKLGVRSSFLFKSPMVQMVEWGRDGVKEFSKFGLRGKRYFYDRAQRVLHTHIMDDAQIQGRGAKEISAQQLRDDLLRDVAAVEDRAQRNYAEMNVKLFGVGPQGQFLDNSIGFKWMRKLADKKLTEAEFQAISDEFAIARGKGSTVTQDQIVPQWLRDKFDATQMRDFMEWVTKQADIDDAYYAKMGALEVQYGLLKPEELVKGYRPQMYDVNEIRADRQGFANLLRETWGKNPTENFINDVIGEYDADGALRKWSGIQEVEDELGADIANQIRSEYSWVVRRQAEDKLEDTLDRVSSELKKFNAKSREEVEQNWLKATKRDRERYDTLVKKIDEATDETADLDKMIDEAANLERKIEESSRKMQPLLALDNSAKSLQKFINEAAPRRVRAKSKKLQRIVERATKRADKELKLIDDEIEKVIDNILDGKFVGGHAFDEFTTNSSRLMHRSIEFGDLRYTDRARRFLDRNGVTARRAYDMTVSPQIALRRALPIDTNLAPAEYKTALRKWMTEEAQKDVDKLAVQGDRGSKLHKQAVKFLNDSEKWTDDILAEFTNSHRGGSQTVHNLVSGTMSGTSMALLGGGVLQSATDFATLVSSGNRVSSQLKYLMRRPGKIIKEMSDRDMAVMLMGDNLVNTGRLNAVLDIDDNLVVAGGAMTAYARGAQNWAQVNGYANFMTPWNKFMRPRATVGFADHIDQTFSKPNFWDNLPKRDQRLFLKRGIDKEMAERIAKLLDEHSQPLDPKMPVRMPIASEWDKVDPVAHLHYKLLLNDAGEEALLAPGVGDRPFMRMYPMGRIASHFTSFMYTAGARFIPRMIQDLAVNGPSIQWASTVAMIMFWSPMVSAMQHARYGKFDEWLASWNDDDKRKDVFWDALARSPLLIGHTGMLLELYQLYGAKPSNDLFEMVGAGRPMKESPSRFRQGQGFFSILGATPALVLGTGGQMLGQLGEGEYEKVLDTMSKRLPIINAFWANKILQIMRD